MDLVVVFALFVFMLALLCFCVATVFSANKDLYNNYKRVPYPSTTRRNYIASCSSPVSQHVLSFGDRWLSMSTVFTKRERTTGNACTWLLHQSVNLIPLIRLSSAHSLRLISETREHSPQFFNVLYLTKNLLVIKTVVHLLLLLHCRCIHVLYL